MAQCRTQWDDDAQISQSIEVKRNALAILYLRKVDHWLQSQNTSNKLYTIFKNVQATLKGKVVRLNMKHLEPLASFLEKSFDKKPEVKPEVRPVDTVDLTLDDNERTIQVQREAEFDSNPVPEISVEENSPQEIDAQNGTTSSSPPVFSSAISSELSNTTTPPPSVPYPTQELPSASSLNRCLSLSERTLSNSSNQSSSQKSSGGKTAIQRRKSISKLSPDVPSIAIYKIKQHKLQPPSIYAKPKDPNAEVPVRQIISVPYKNAPRPTAAPYDPIEHITKIAGIKEKIYAKNFLRLDAEKKEEMQKELLAQKENSDIEISEEELNLPSPKQKRKRRKSVTSAKAKAKTEAPQPKKKRKRPNESVSEEVAREVKKPSAAEKRMTRSKSICLSSLNPTKQKINSKIPLKSFVQEKNISEASNETDPSTTSQQLQDIAHHVDPNVYEEQSSTSEKDNVLPLPKEKSAPKPVQTRKGGQGLSEARMLRSKSMLVASTNLHNFSAKISQKRGRPRLNKFVGQGIRPSLEQLVKNSHIETFSHDNVDVNSNILPEDDDLLVEIPGKRKKPRRVSYFVPRRRRNAVDTIVQIKEEPVDCLSIAQN